MRLRKIAGVLGAVGLLASAGADSAAAARLEVIDTPSRHVDPATATFAGGGVGALRATVRLPDGYDGRTPLPVLYLLHPTGGDHATWAKPDEGDVMTIAPDLEAIVVMPEAGLGFLTNWWNGGRRSDPAWERYYLEELIPLVERRYAIRPGRRWHAIAGYSMGGMGAPFLAGQLPSYFGAAVSLSGFPSIQRAYLEPIWQAFAGVDYRAVWGPAGGFYAEGHNPTALAGNLRHTRLFVSARNGVPRPGAPAPATGAVGLPFLSLVEQESRQESDDLVRAARGAGVDVHDSTGAGIHDWPYVREDLEAAVRWGLFEPVAEDPQEWAYRTVSQRGDAWGIEYAFEEPPAAVQTLRRESHVLSGDGEGRVTLATAGGCELSAALPFRVELPDEPCASGRLRLTVTPARVRPGRRARLVFIATTLVRGEAAPVAGATVRLGRRSAVTGRGGRAAMRFRASRGGRVLRATVSKPGLEAGAAAIRILRR